MATIAEWRTGLAGLRSLWPSPGYCPTLPALVFAGLAVAAVTSASAQYTPPPPPLTQAPCVPTKKVSCAPDPGDVAPSAAGSADRIPFPGVTPSSALTAPPAAATANPFPGDSSPVPAAPKPSSAAAANPFPGEAAADSSSSSSSSSVPDPEPDSSADKTSDAASAKTPVSPRAARRLLPKSPKSMADREAEDLDVSKFYLQSGNYLGAYLRAEDAVKSVPDDSEAHYALAEAARKMKKPDEAVKEYKAYLDLEPDGDHVRAARQALAELTH